VAIASTNGQVLDQLRSEVSMAHFAEIKDNIVQRVLVVNDNDEHRGQEFLAEDLGLGGIWIQCSYNGTIRKQFPGVGYTYDPVSDVFIAPQPFPSWTLDTNFDWQPPTPRPGSEMVWNEEKQVWE
jgi:hypothetical protein